MTASTENLPEPLLLAARSAARLMAEGGGGTCGEDGKLHNYRQLAQEYGEALLAVMQAEMERVASGRTLRRANELLYKSRPKRGDLFLLAVCDASRPERPVTVLRSTDKLYIVTAAGGKSSPGLVVRKVLARGAV